MLGFLAFVQQPLVRLQKLAFVAQKALAKNSPPALQVWGLHLNGHRRALALASVEVATLGLLFLCAPGSISSGAAILSFLAALGLRFGFLFASFTPTGIAARLTARFGVERGHVLYSTALDLVQFAQRASFILLVCATLREPAGLLGQMVQVLGALLVPVGIGATVWAARIVGLGAYHYRDLFTKARQLNIEDDGPYRVCKSPMYELGPLAGYGIALVALSPIGLLAIAINQALLLLFNATVEQPRLQRAHGIFVETQRRYALARTLLGFDPREELAQRRHQLASSQPSSDASHLST